VDVKVSGTGPQADVELQVDPTHSASRVSLKPLEYAEVGKPGIGGHYFVDGASGALTGVGANGPIFSFRWSDTKYLAVLKRVSMVYYITTAYTTAQMNDFELICATGFTASDTGGTALTPVRKRVNLMSASVATDVRISSTAALGGGTRTLDAAGLRFVADGPANVAIPTATLAVPRQELLLYDNKEFGVHPKVFGKDEGFLVRAVTAMGAVGVIKAYVMAEWAEVAQY
jgi:hypothetical protein